MKKVCAHCRRLTLENSMPTGEALSDAEQRGATHGICRPCFEDRFGPWDEEEYQKLAKHSHWWPTLAHLSIREGTPVCVRLDDGSEVVTLARSLPWALGHGTWVVLLEGIRGCYVLERVTPWPARAEGEAA